MEGGCEALEISRNDMDGSLYRTETGDRAIVLFDTVPGGAGGARLIANFLEKVVGGAIERVESCECGEETSCYACLRGYRNGRYHEQLTRRGAMSLLGYLRPARPAGRVAGAPAATGLAPEWQNLVDFALTEAELDLLEWMSGSGLPVPAQGWEGPDGIPYALAWPGLHLGVIDDDAAAQPGWTLLSMDDPALQSTLLDLLSATAGTEA